MNTQQMIDQLNDIHKGLAGIGCLSNEAYQYFSEKLIRVKEALAKNLPQAAISGSILMNILEDNYDLNKQFHEISREMIYSFATANYNETLTFEAWLDKYYR